MIALDTNVVVRFLVNDEPAQAHRARALIERGGVSVGATVLLEAEWVLRSAYGLPAARIHDLFRNLLGLPGLETNDPAQINRALDAYEAGLDFADALHLTLAESADAFATFDTRLAKRARRLVGVKIVVP